MTKRQRSGFYILIILILIAEMIIQFYSFQDNSNQNLKFTPTEEAIALLLNSEQEEETKNYTEDIVILKPFNPNELDESGFVNVGFSFKQAKSIITYRNSLGGNFSSVQEFADAYVISDWMFKKIEDYIDLKPFKPNLIKDKYATNKSEKINDKFKHHTILKPFYINRLSLVQIKELGFSEKQAQTILNFKNSLPNQEFANLEQFQQCFAVNDYMFEKLKPYMRFEKTASSHPKTKSKPTKNWNPNTMSQSDWENLGFDKNNASNIIKYREFVGGFNSLEDVRKCKFISEEEFSRIKEFLQFE